MNMFAARSLLLWTICCYLVFVFSECDTKTRLFVCGSPLLLGTDNPISIYKNVPLEVNALLPPGETLTDFSVFSQKVVLTTSGGKVLFFGSNQNYCFFVPLGKENKKPVIWGPNFMGLVVDSEILMKAVTLIDFVVLFYETQAVIYGKGTTYGEYTRILRIPKECQNYEYFPPHGTSGYMFLARNNTLCALSAKGDFFLGEADGTSQFSFSVFPTEAWLPKGRKIVQITHTTQGYIILTNYGELYSFGLYSFTLPLSLAQKFPSPPFLFPFFGMQLQRPSSIALPRKSAVFPSKPMIIDVSSTGDNIALMFSDNTITYTLNLDRYDVQFHNKSLPRQFSVGSSHYMHLEPKDSAGRSQISVFGTNEYGQFGNGMTDHSPEPKIGFMNMDFVNNLPVEPGEGPHNVTFIEAETENSFIGVDFPLSPICNGVSYTELSVCSARGKCISEDKCSCFIGHYGKNCEKSYVCGGKSNDDDKVCGGFGNCVENEKCECFEGYYGQQCENFKCFGVPALGRRSDDKICSGNGDCTAPDVCQCKKGWIGLDCSIKDGTNPDIFYASQYYDFNLREGPLASVLLQKKLKNGESVKKIVTATTSILVLTTEGRLFSYGVDKYFESGFGMDKFGMSEANELEFFQNFRIKSGITVQDIAAGATFAFAYLSNNKLYLWGTFSNGANSEAIGTDATIFTYPHQFDKYFEIPETFIFDQNFKVYAFQNLAFGVSGSKIISLTKQAAEVSGFEMHNIVENVEYSPDGNEMHRTSNSIFGDNFKAISAESMKIAKLCVLKNGVIALLKNGDVYGFGVNDAVDFPLSSEKYSNILFPGHSTKRYYHISQEFEVSKQRNSIFNFFGWLQSPRYDIIDLQCSQSGKAAAFRRGSTNEWFAWGRNTKNIFGMSCGFDSTRCGAFQFPKKIDGDFGGANTQNEPLVDISLGDAHSLFLTKSGKLFASGSNSNKGVNFDERVVSSLEYPREIKFLQTTRNLTLSYILATTPGSFISSFPKDSNSESQNWKCFGFPKEFTIGCSGNGVCAGPDYCVCSPSFWGNSCERYIVADIFIISIFLFTFMACFCAIIGCATVLLVGFVALFSLCSCFFMVSNYRVNSYKKHQKKKLLHSLINPANGEFFEGDIAESTCFIDQNSGEIYPDYSTGININISGKREQNSQHSQSGKSPFSSPSKRNKFANGMLKFDSDLFNIDFNDIKDLEELEAGGSGALAFKGKWKQEIVFCKLFVAICDSVNGPDLASFRTEVSLLSSLKHSNIVSFFGLFYAPPTRVGYVTEFCPGGNLYQVLKRKKLTLKKKLHYLIQICKGMRFLHQKGVIFRDLKCQNILLDENDVIKLTDFGISRRVDSEEKKRLTQRIGTNQYMAPEMVKGEEYDAKVDVFSFGIVMYELLFETSNPYGKEFSKISIEYKVAQDPQFRPKKPTADIWSTKPEEMALFDPLFSIMEKAWSDKASDRPDFASLVIQLSALYFELP